MRNVLDTWGREVVLLFFMTAHWRKPMDFTDETLEQAKAQVEGFRNVFRSPSEPGADWAAFEAALDDDFNTPEALALLHGWRDHELLRRGLELFGLGSLAEAEDAPPDARRRSPSGARRRVPPAISPRPTGCATRLPMPAGWCATTPAASTSCPR